MNSILSGLAGAAALALAYGLFLAWRKTGKAAGDLVAAFQGIPQLVKSNLEVTAALHRFSGELEFLRTAMIGGTPPEAAPEAGGAPPAPRTPSGKPLPQFPPWAPYVAVAADVPDAEVSDTEVLEQDDAALVEQEQLEEIRGLGFAAGPEADPTQNPPGVEANV
jgi:hypothetical protein